LSTASKKDSSGLYEKAKRGEINNLPGVDVKYEVPANGAFNVDFSKTEKEIAVQMILKTLNNE